MSEIFKRHLEKFIEIDQEEFLKILSFFEMQALSKKENLLVAGQRCQSHFFVLSGCLRKFFINQKGIEQTTEFAIESWWMTDQLAYERGDSSEFYIQAVEHTQILTYKAAEKIFDNQMITQLIMAVVTINAWNRIAISCQMEPAN